MLHIRAQRRTESDRDEQGYRRRELRYGSFSRSLSLPKDVKESDVEATYADGILEVRVPVPKTSSTKIPVTKH